MSDISWCQPGLRNTFGRPFLASSRRVAVALPALAAPHEAKGTFAWWRWEVGDAKMLQRMTGWESGCWFLLIFVRVWWSLAVVFETPLDIFGFYIPRNCVNFFWTWLWIVQDWCVCCTFLCLSKYLYLLSPRCLKVRLPAACRPYQRCALLFPHLLLQPIGSSS